MKDKIRLHESYAENKARIVDEFEREFLLQFLCAHFGNETATARSARMDRKHLRELAKKHGLAGFGRSKRAT